MVYVFWHACAALQTFDDYVPRAQLLERMSAMRDVLLELNGRVVRADREVILAQTLADSRRAFDIVQTQFRVGRTDLRYVTQRQLALNASQSALLRVQAEQRVQRVNLHLALGGGF